MGIEYLEVGMKQGRILKDYHVSKPDDIWDDDTLNEICRTKEDKQI